MSKSKDIYSQTKNHIISLLEKSDYSQRKIADICGVSQSAVSIIKKNMSKSQQSSNLYRKRYGKKKSTNQRTDRVILRTSVENRNSSCAEISRKLQTQNVNVSRYEFRKNEKVGLHELGPSFTMQLRAIQKGSLDSNEEFEWIYKRRKLHSHRRQFYM
ncbi:hypothetical protein A3Q56_02316 [Intoshia linei]|uniref:Uncharacterized protein n=1 Tax=Intoshia linei TaxID=1819745 RepID=A0A177B940_9BILA|nr:hypothetical protein A3Q56_02316 [Intoshia linei]